MAIYAERMFAWILIKTKYVIQVSPLQRVLLVVFYLIIAVSELTSPYLRVKPRRLSRVGKCLMPLFQ